MMHDFIHRLSSAAFLCLFLAAFCSDTLAQNVDTLQPIIRSPPSSLQDQPGGYFGYSLVLHQVATSASDFQRAVENSRILVSAPNGTAPGGVVPNTGLIFTCPLQPGECEGLTGNGQGNDNRLFDTQTNATNEDKQGQFLGSSMYSNGETFIACAHRYLVLIDGTPYPVGRCFFSGRTLENFTEYSPCRDANTNTQYLCMAGAGSTLAETNEGYAAIGVGLPGAGIEEESNNTFFYSFEGGVYRRNQAGNSIFLEGTVNASLQGYTMTTGHILSQDREDFIVSSPRLVKFLPGNPSGTLPLQQYTGGVEIVMNSDPVLQVVTDNDLRGEQHGEYYGFSVVALDLNGDGYDELVVGSPLYRDGPGSPEAGRVYVYRNTGNSGSLVFRAPHLTGDREPYSRFGYAMANLGDINGDGLEDVAISAPYGTGPGKVFIYTGSLSTIISQSPVQVISGSDLSTNPPLINLRGFGTSLASGVDVDGNTYNDLAIGTFESQRVFLLRTRPIAFVSSSLSALPPIVDLDLLNCTSLQTGSTHSCFRIAACATYSGRGLNSILELTYNLTVERTNQQLGLQQRLFFDTPGQPITIAVRQMATAGVETCTDFTVYVVNGIADRLNAFTLEFEVSPPSMTVSTSTGNDSLVDFSVFPTVSMTGTRTLQVETAKDCDGGVCYPDLNLQHSGTTFQSRLPGEQPTMLISGLVSNISLGLNISNQRDDAFQAVLSFSLPSALLEFVRVEPRSAFITCSSQPVNSMLTQHRCNIGNPFGANQQLAIGLILRPTTFLTGEEPPINLTFTLSSANSELLIDDLANNMVGVSLETGARADLSILTSTVAPQQVFYAQTPPEEEIESVQDLGPEITTTFVVRNAGPSLIPNTQIVVYWPLNGSLTNSSYYLYPAIISGQSTGGRILCNMTFSNPDGLPLLTPGSATIANTTTSEGNTEDVEAQDITLSCEDPNNSGDLVCVPIVCSISQLQQGGTATLAITSYLDERYFATTQDSFTIVTAATVSIVGADYIQQVGEPTTSTAQLLAFPPLPVPTQPPPGTPPTGGGGGVEPWIIIVSVVAAVLFIAVLAGLLWGCGFFSRKKHREIRRKRQALTDPTASTENILEGEVEPSRDTINGKD